MLLSQVPLGHLLRASNESNLNVIGVWIRVCHFAAENKGYNIASNRPVFEIIAAFPFRVVYIRAL